MKIESNQIDPKTRSGGMKLVPNNNDDIYYLSLIILPGDKISSYTTRKLSLDGGKTQKKITLKLEIKVEAVDSDLETGIMYIKGKTSCEHEHVRIGSYHTLDVAVGTEFTLTKKEWKQSDISKINKCCKEVPEICFVIFFEKGCAVSTVSSNEINIVYKEDARSKTFKDLVCNTIKIKSKVKSIVIAGASEIRNEFHKQLLSTDSAISKITIVLKLTPDYKGLSNSKVISKILSDPNMLPSLQNLKFVDDLKEIQKFFVSIDLNQEEVCIGLKEVSEALDYGAVKTLFVTDKFCKPKTVSEREFADSFIKKADELRAKVCIIPVGLDLGERLETIGSVACSLSFNYK